MGQSKNGMLSFGAGINSVAMTILLVENGWRGPIVFADTGGEHPETYCYMEYFEREFLAKYNLAIQRISPTTHPELYDDKYTGEANTLEKYCLIHKIIPFLSVRWCSVQFKRKPLKNWLGHDDCNIAFIGFSANEPHRLRDDPTQQYPLVEHGITRGECTRIIQQAGLDVPRKSGCFFCPGQSIGQWKHLYFEHPDLYDRAITLEEIATAGTGRPVTLDPHGTSLRQHLKRRWAGQMEMDLSPWLPCICKL